MGYTSREVAKILGLSASKVRAFARDGVVQPGRAARGALVFSFQDLIAMKTAAGLERAGIRPRKVKRALRQLRRRLAPDRPLGTIRILADGEDVAIVEDGTAWLPESGQILFGFAVKDLADQAAPLARRSVADAIRDEKSHDASTWFALACELEDVDPDGAREAYRRVLELDPSSSDAHINLGRLLQERGDVAAAEGHYRAAIAIEPSSAIGSFNLGVALEERKKYAEAFRAYRRAVGCDPDLADAWFNLSLLAERNGDAKAALRYLKRYRDLVLRERGRKGG